MKKPVWLFIGILFALPIKSFSHDAPHLPAPPGIITSDFGQVQVISQTDNVVFKALSMVGQAGENQVLIQDFERELPEGVYRVVLTASSETQTATAENIFKVL